MRTFKLTDDCTLSGVRLRPEDRRVDGGGYFYPDCPDRLVPAHGVVEVPVGGAGLKAPAACQRRWNAGGGEVVGRRLKPGERVVANPYYPEG